MNEDFRAPNQLLGLLQQTKEIGCLPGMQEILEVFFNVCGGNIGPFQNLANIDLDMQQSLSPSFNLGVLWEPTDWFAWGATYQSESRMRAQGQVPGRLRPRLAGFLDRGAQVARWCDPRPDVPLRERR